MSSELLIILVDAGIGIFSVFVIAFLFFHLMKTHTKERSEWRDSSEKQTDKMVKAIGDLARDINNK